MTEKIASLKNIKKSYEKQILNIDNFDILAGQCTIITGKNGSGKSTLLKIIAGLIDADYGSIDFQKQLFAAKKRHLLSNQSVYLSTNHYLFDCSVWHNIAYPLLIRKQFNYKRYVTEVLGWANLTHLSKRHVGGLSSGEKQRVAIARAYIINPTVWLLDEPTENLDTQSKNQFYVLLNQLLIKQKSVIIVSHSKEVFKQVPHKNLQLVNQDLENDDY